MGRASMSRVRKPKKEVEEHIDQDPERDLYRVSHAIADVVRTPGLWTEEDVVDALGHRGWLPETVRLALKARPWLLNGRPDS